jgi:hypothetical protein
MIENFIITVENLGLEIVDRFLQRSYQAFQDYVGSLRHGTVMGQYISYVTNLVQLYGKKF